ncbi:MAG: DUF4331 family protein [Candidatus Eremiobacteraeota bacterium]|nr:DUF4331 family protein [Candidatus Eremiobacteraeota bacterium]
MKLSRFFFTAVAAAFVLSACGGSGGSTLQSGGLPAGTSSGPTALGPGPFKQLDRLNRPAINEVFATFAEHQQNNIDTPDQDVANLKPEIIAFTTGVAGRSNAIANVLGTVLTPDVQIADMSGTSSSCIGQAPGSCNNYLGIETAGATQIPSGLKPFGGRALTDDIVDISLEAIFGNVIPALGLAPDDNKELDGRADPAFPSGHRPNLTSDGVTWQTAPKHFTTTFPYLGVPQ